MDDFDVFATAPTSAQQNGLFESDGAPTDNQKDESSWVIENNPDVTTPFQSNIVGEDNLTSSADDAFDNTTPSSHPPVNLDERETLIKTPPPTENTFPDPPANERYDDKSFSNMFINESASPLQAINKKREEEIATKDAEEHRKIDELRQQAKADLERWYKDREQQMEQKRQKMITSDEDLRAKALEKSSKETCDWSKVIRLLELNDGTQISKSKRDLTRMKSCLLTARRTTENKKAANGI